MVCAGGGEGGTLRGRSNQHIGTKAERVWNVCRVRYTTEMVFFILLNNFFFQKYSKFKVGDVGLLCGRERLLRSTCTVDREDDVWGGGVIYPCDDTVASNEPRTA